MACHYIRNWLFLSIGILCSTQAAHRENLPVLLEKEPVYNPRSVLIFLDESEASKKHIGSLSQGAIQALCQNAGPFIASRALLYNVLKEYTQLDAKAVAALADKKEPTTSDLLNAGKFQPNQWLFKEVNPYICVALPQTHLDTLGLSRDDVKHTNPTSITDTERLVGLRVNHLRDITTADIIAGYASLAQIPRPSHFIDALIDNALFCTHGDYKNSTIPQPLWAWYLYGHGAMNRYIACLTIPEFKLVLEYLNTSVNTRFLMYSSCYAAGSNMQRVYEDAESGIQATYPFAIMVHALTDNITYGDTPTITKTSSGVELNMPSHYQEYLQSTCQEALDYEKIAETISSSLVRHLQQNITANTQWNNTPWLRLPGVPWFRMLPGHHDVVTLGKTLVEQRPADKPLSLGSYFKATPRALLIQSPHIPFELKVNYPELQAIRSITPGASTHILQGLSSNKHSLHAMLQWFMNIEKLPREQTFYIPHMHASGDATQHTSYEVNGDLYEVIITNKNQPDGRFNSFFVTSPDAGSPLYYYDRQYVVIGSFPWEEVSDADQKLYQELREQVRDTAQ